MVVEVCLNPVYGRSPEHGGDMTTAVGLVGIRRFIEKHNQDAVSAGLEGRIRRQRRDHVCLQPTVGLLRRAVVRIVVDIGNDE